MATINMMRGLLVAGAVLAVVVAVVLGQWAAAVILSAGIVAHAALWIRLHRERSAATQPADQPPAASSS